VLDRLVATQQYSIPLSGHKLSRRHRNLRKVSWRKCGGAVGLSVPIRYVNPIDSLTTAEPDALAQSSPTSERVTR
jgi:hypothetical protein